MYKETIISELNTFKSITLEDLGTALLMNRFESKYILPALKLPELVRMSEGRFKVLEINNLRAHSYTTTYMDTPDNNFYNQHVRGELERNKIRFRKYESSGNIFLEVKKKSNKGRTCKWRTTEFERNGYIDKHALAFLNRHIDINSAPLSPTLVNYFTRATLVSLDFRERVTLDFDISFTDTGDSMKTISLPFLAIAEVKKEGFAHRSEFQTLLKQMNIRPSGFSKFCYGSAILNGNLKKNMLKEKLLLLNRIENEHISSYYC